MTTTDTLCPICQNYVPATEIARLASDHMTGQPGPTLIRLDWHQLDDNNRYTACPGVSLVKAADA